MESKTKTYDYGDCHICGTHMLEKRIKQDFWIQDQLIVVDEVPAGVCPRCGEKIVRADIGLRLAALIRSSEQIARAPRISVPAIKFDYAEAA